MNPEFCDGGQKKWKQGDPQARPNEAEYGVGTETSIVISKDERVQHRDSRGR